MSLRFKVGLLLGIFLSTAFAFAQNGGQSQPAATAAVSQPAPEALTGAGVPAAVHYISHDTIAALIATSGGGNTVNDPGLYASIVRKGKDNVEYHDHTNHIFIMIEGEATFVAGGTLVNPRRISADHMTAASIEGGQIYHLSKGDVMMVPAKVPHWWKECSTGTVVYYAVNICSPAGFACNLQPQHQQSKQAKP